VSGDANAAPAVPAFSVVRGRPTEEELAALVVVLAARATVEPPPAASPVSGWSSYARALRTPPLPGPGAWRAATRPA